MKTIYALCLALVPWLVPAAAAAEVSAFARTDNVEARLIAETDAAAPGGMLTLALRLKIREHWHTYWINPGDSGEATAIDWTLPQGVEAGPLEFPYPRRITVGPLVNFGFDGTVLHVTQMRIPENAVPGQVLTFTAAANWLVCDDICIPEEATLTLSVPVAANPAPDGLFSGEFAAFRARQPQAFPGNAEFGFANGQLILALTGAPEMSGETAFFPFEGGFIENAPAQNLSAAGGQAVLLMTAGRRFATPERAAAVTALAGVLVTGGKAYVIDAKRNDAAAAGQAPSALQPGQSGAAPGPVLSLWTALGFAFLGGVILNLMPCVFPVLSMKALALAGKGGKNSGARAGGLAYTAGVVLSFVALAAALYALRAGGDLIGWGFQLQSPLIVAALAALFFLIGLNLMGVFEAGLSIQQLGAQQPGKDGLTGSFFTGVLAAVVAAPCTAPFMGAAVGAAITQPPAIGLAIFASLGLGMAAPYLALAFSPGLVRRMPKPGPWMERLKQVLAFPMFGSAVWLIWVLTVQAGPGALVYLLSALTLLAFAAWVYGLAQRGEARGIWRLAAPLGLALALAALVVMPRAGYTPAQAAAGEGPVYEAYSPARLAALRAEGKPVFVNLTAAWCVTCLVNEQVALSSGTVAGFFAKAGIVYLKGDWTNRDPDITRLLELHGRAGVPLYLFYRPGAATAEILPQLLTESLVLEALGG